MGADLEVSFNEILFRATEICDVLMDDWNPTVGVDCRISIGFQSSSKSFGIQIDLPYKKPSDVRCHQGIKWVHKFAFLVESSRRSRCFFQAYSGNLSKNSHEVRSCIKCDPQVCFFESLPVVKLNTESLLLSLPTTPSVALYTQYTLQSFST
jgi:hypothetical protein